MTESHPATRATASTGPQADVLGVGFTAETLPLGRDDEGDVVATLVRRPADTATSRAVLYVHGFSDYFFQVELAEWWAARGYHFYAVDLRKYGRSLRPQQTPAWATDLSTYFDDLDAAWEQITVHDGNQSVVVLGHSTGGLICPLWLHHRRPRGVVGLVLNSPWFDLQGAAWRRTPPGRLALELAGAKQPRRPLPRKISIFYARSLHRDFGGEWDYDRSWKPDSGLPVYLGWLRGIRRGHAELHRGLDVPCPCLVLSSSRTSWPREFGEEVHTHDVVLDVRQIRRWASSLGRHVTSIAIDDARHDIFLSRPAVRERAYREVAIWLATYVESDDRADCSGDREGHQRDHADHHDDRP